MENLTTYTSPKNEKKTTKKQTFVTPKQIRLNETLIRTFS